MRRQGHHEAEPRSLAGTPVLMLILGTGLAAAEAIGHGWRDAIPIEVVTVVAAVGYFLVGGLDHDIGAIYGSRGDERQHMVRPRAGTGSAADRSRRRDRFHGPGHAPGSHLAIRGHCRGCCVVRDRPGVMWVHQAS